MLFTSTEKDKKKKKDTAIYYELIKLINILDSSYIFAFIFL